MYDEGCAHCHDENDLHLKKVPPDLHGLFSRNTLPDGAPATDAEVVRVINGRKGNDALVCLSIKQAAGGCIAGLSAHGHAGRATITGGGR